MKSTVRTSSMIAVLLCLPLVMSCSKAKYEQVKKDPRVQTNHDRVVTPEPHGNPDVRPVPPTTEPNQPAQPPKKHRPKKPGPIVIPDQPTQPIEELPVDEPPTTVTDDTPWKDPTRYDRDEQAGPPLPPPCKNCQPQPPPKTGECLDCFKADWQQPQSGATDKLDILFVVDTSESIFKERLAAANHIDRLVSALPRNVDYNIGVVLAHGPSTGLAGQMYTSPDGEPTVLKSAQLSLANIRASLRSKLTKFPSDRLSDGGELGLLSLMKAMEGNTMTRNLNLGMFRYDAGLAVIFIADENDICSRGLYPKGVSPKADPNQDEIPAAKKYCNGITPQAVYAKILQVKSEKNAPTNYANVRQKLIKPVILGAVVYTHPETVPNNPKVEKWAAENEVGYGYMDIVRLNNGVAIDLAIGDISGALQRIGYLTSQKLSLKTEFSIPTAGVVDEQTICVLVDNREVGHRYDSRTRQIQIIEVGRENSLVEFFYCTDGAGPLPPSGNKYERMQIDPRCTTLKKRFKR